MIGESDSGALKQFALVGGSVSGSLSPSIHQSMMSLSDIEGRYRALDAERDDVVKIVDRLRQRSLHGINVTMPHKTLAATLCDVVVGPAANSGSVNTLRLVDGMVEGSSTDSLVFNALSARFDSCPSVLILGSGGSALAALAAFTEWDVYVSSRNPAGREELAELFAFETVAWGAGVAGSLVVNATPLGALGEGLADNVLGVAGGLIDLPYSAIPTPAIRYCREKDVPSVEGTEFLIRQAIESFRIWTGVHLGYEDVRGRL